jgi:hypothetical protein
LPAIIRVATPPRQVNMPEVRRPIRSGIHRHTMRPTKAETATQITTAIGKTGVGLLRNGAGPTVMLRADMDALPVEEATGLAYASKVRATDRDGKTVPVMSAKGQQRWQVERRKGSQHMEQEDGARVSIAYLRFAEDEVRDKSPLYCELLRGAASDPEVIGFLLTLPREKRQPNLFLAATRHLFGTPAGGISCEAACCRTRTPCEP